MKESMTAHISNLVSKNSNHSLEEENKILKDQLTRIAMELMDSRAEVERLKMKEKVKADSRPSKEEKDANLKMKENIRSELKSRRSKEGRDNDLFEVSIFFKSLIS